MTFLDEALGQSVRQAMAQAGIEVVGVAVRRFPGECIIVVEVFEDQFQRALGVVDSYEGLPEGAFITVRRTQRTQSAPVAGVHSLADARITKLVETIQARTRTSESQPSLTYVHDVDENLNLCVTPRHHLIFGRRGVGKSSLMVEAKRVVESRGALSAWINLQTYRSLDAYEAFANAAVQILECFLAVGKLSDERRLGFQKAWDLHRVMESLTTRDSSDIRAELRRQLPQLQQAIALICAELQTDFYLFLDDMHYLPMSELPMFLDLVHAISRDSRMWIKAAGIRHQSRWFTDDPPVGLQTGQDANVIDLDITLETPEKARDFLFTILQAYVSGVSIKSATSFISNDAIDRLVLASGGVPRDFLTLVATAIQVARRRLKARSAGVQDVNEAAGELAKPKKLELEDDAASSIGKAESRLSALQVLQDFLLEDKRTTYFRIDFKDKESHPREYDLLQSLMDLRQIHLIKSSLSDEHSAGRRFEVYTLDLSHFSGSRVKHNLRMLDFQNKNMALKITGTNVAPRVGSSPRKLLGILRRGPLFDLTLLGAAAGVVPQPH